MFFGFALWWDHVLSLGIGRTLARCIVKGSCGMTLTVLLTGASGLLGRQILHVFEKEPTWTTIGLAFSRSKGNLHKVDLTNSDELTGTFEKYSPNVIVHAAAERRPDTVEHNPEATHALNVAATNNICTLAEKYKAIVVYVSTDYVFDGKNAPYKESDDPHPLNRYGQSKLEGERVVQNANKGNLILRVPILYGPLEFLDESAVTTLFRAVQDVGKDCKMNSVQRRFPTHTSDVAMVVRDLVKLKTKDRSVSGIYHWSDSENLTKYDMAIAMAEAFGLSTEHIKADASNTGTANRPHDAHLDSGKIEELGICHRRDFKSAVKECLGPFCKQ